MKKIQYELWNGSKVIGSVVLIDPLQGRFIAVWDKGELKPVFFPIILRKVYETHSDSLFRLVIDVRRKSKRQIKIICGKKRKIYYGLPNRAID